MKNSPSNAAFKENHKIRVKLSGDGTNIGKRLHVINVTFTVLDEGTLAQAAGGNHLIAVIKEPENSEKTSQSIDRHPKRYRIFKTFVSGNRAV